MSNIAPLSAAQAIEEERREAFPEVIDGPPPALTRGDVARLAGLARLDLTDAELGTYVGQLTVILESVAQVSEVVQVAEAASGQSVAPTSHAVPLTNVFRDDVVRPGLDRDAALGGAPDAQDGMFRVPQILGAAE